VDERSEIVRYEVDSGVATVTLNRPTVLNAIDLATGRAYNAALRRADAEPEVRAIVIAGAGRAFCAGADLASMEAAPASTAEERLPSDGLAPELAMLSRKPVIAAVHGPAIGVGLVLALYADVRFVASDAILSFAFTRLGLVAEYGTAWLLPRMLGAVRATELLLSSRRFTGSDAVSIGLAHCSLPAGEVRPAAYAYARDLVANCSPAALAATKQQLRDGYGDGLAAALADSRARMLAALDSDDLLEGFAALSQRRAPLFAPLSVDS
jgi:enoyl-CoA hydratase/carnithine racemase